LAFRANWRIILRGITVHRRASGLRGAAISSTGSNSMTEKGKIAPVRPSIAKILKRQIGGFVREYEREVNRPPQPARKPEADKGATTQSPEKKES
jgi:hypothetical protein